MTPADIPILSPSDSATLVCRCFVQWADHVLTISRQLTPGWDGGQELNALIEAAQEKLAANSYIAAGGFCPLLDFDKNLISCELNPIISARRR